MTGTALDHWWPVTYDYGLIRCDLERVVHARRKMYRDAGLTVTSSDVDAPLAECFSMLEPLSPAPTKELYLTTTFGWTSFFSNGCRGSDPSLPMKQLAETLGTMSLRACATPEDFPYQSVILEVYDAPQSGADQYGYRRTIAASNDGGRWVFEQSGEPFQFEDTSHYDARRKRERFTREMLAANLVDLGAQPLTERALQNGAACSGFLLERPEHRHLPQYSLAEAKTLPAKQAKQ